MAAVYLSNHLPVGKWLGSSGEFDVKNCLFYSLFAPHIDTSLAHYWPWGNAGNGT
jgi:hypothetical protein